jgi:hypothetical protein
MGDPRLCVPDDRKPVHALKHPHEASALRVPLLVIQAQARCCPEQFEHLWFRRVRTGTALWLVIPAQAGGAFQQTKVWSSSRRAA